MIDLSGFRPFSLAAFDRALTPGIYGPAQLITACQVKQMGFVDAHEPSAGAWALASWLLDHRDGIEGAARAGSHPLNSGSLIERILAGDVVPEETFATAIAAMTDGAVLPDMFARPMRMARSEETPDAAGGAPLSADADGKAPEAGAVSPCSSPVPAPSLPRALPETDRCASANTLPEVDPCASANTLPEVDPCASANTLPEVDPCASANTLPEVDPCASANTLPEVDPCASANTLPEVDPCASANTLPEVDPCASANTLPEVDPCASANTLPEVDPCASANTLPEVDPCASANTLPEVDPCASANTLPEVDPCASANTLPEVDPCASANTLPEVDPCASANTLPAMGGLGGALPPGRLFHPIADSRFTDGFVLTGCGIALNLDESTAAAMRAAIDAGLDHLRARRGGAAKAGDTMRKVAA
ncbi:hypothetical protein C100_14920 [Sphingobium sp. C100]|uniref:hypothetical protein n=1 Tax=Sphingobium sp. C100 TaxID=1207055 RepID=UPI0003D5915C|nr:hypothetical protein [Sphingobium sp. C100]ETI63003.1 hypothetical protein C100_14920 [Sphingobium sp. C100]